MRGTVQRAKCSFMVLVFTLAPVSAFAQDILYMNTYDGGDPATTWKYDVRTSAPTGGKACFDSSNHWPDSGFLTVMTLPPPFSGSTSRTRWVTTCRNGDYITYELKISLSGCAAWICDTHYSYQFLRRQGSITYKPSMKVEVLGGHFKLYLN